MPGVASIAYWVTLPDAMGQVVVHDGTIIDTALLWQTWRGQTWRRFHGYYWWKWGTRMEVRELASEEGVPCQE